MATFTQLTEYPILQEYPIQSNFLDQIPLRAQKGLSTFDLEFTCLDSDGTFIAVGSNVGVLYLYNRKKGCVQKLKDSEYRSSTTNVKVLVSLECLVAIGYSDGTVLVYKVPFEENDEFEKFTVKGLHSCAVTALEWAKNGIMFFSGDESGMVVCTEIDHLEHQSRSRKLTQENTKVVQLSYSHQNLVISTLLRSIIFSLKSNSSVQVGQKERKSFGPFGALIFESGETSIVASRPGQRLWKSDLFGVIQETMIFKTVLMTSYPSIKMEAMYNENPCYTDYQFECLANYNSYVLIWCNAYILLIDPNSKTIISSSPNLDPIIDLAVCGNEIFILQGVRHIIRLATEPDAYSDVQMIQEPSVLEDILVPFKELGSFVKERSESLSVTMENPTIFDWLKKQTTSTPFDFDKNSDASKTVEPSTGSEPLPDIVNLSSDDYIPVKIDESSVPVLNITPEVITKDFTNIVDSDDIVFKVKKKNKKHKKVNFQMDSAPKRDRFKTKKSNVLSEKHSENEDVADSDKDLITGDQNKFDDYVTNLNSIAKPDENFLNITSGENHSDSSISDQSNNMSILNSLEKKIEDFISDSKIDCVDSSVNLNLSNNNATEVLGVDSDKLLEDVLNTYSLLKHHHSSTLNSSDTVNISNSNNIYDSRCGNVSDVVDGKNNNPPDLSLNFDGSTDLDSVKTPDADEVYSLFLASMSETQGDLTPKTSEAPPDSISLDESSSSSLDTKKEEPPKYGVDWVQYKAPELLLDISVSNDHIFCVDVKNRLYFSKLPKQGSLHWMELSQPAEKVAASASESVVWVLYKGTVFAAAQKAQFWVDTEWISVAREVVSVAVDDDCGWYIKSSGELLTQQELTALNPYSYPQSVPCSSPALQVAVRNGVLWVLTVGGSLLAKSVKDGKHFKTKWREIKLKTVTSINSIFLGPLKIGWVVDYNGMIYFLINVTPDTPGGTGDPWLVEVSSYLFRPETQLEQVMRRALSSEVLTNLIRGKQHLCLSACDLGVWFCKTYDNLLYSNQKSIIGHMWEMVIPPSTASATKWKLIAADGINNSEGALWCVNSNSELFCFDIKNRTFTPVELPPSESSRCLQPSYQSLWLLSESGSIYVRREITAHCLQGKWWQALDLLQLEMQEVVHISCSQFVSWACTREGDILMRLGSLNPSKSKLKQAWLSIGPANDDATSPLVKLSAIGKHFPLPLIPSHCSEDSSCKVYVGPLGYPVWATDRKQNVYVREGVTPNLPIGERWIPVPELCAKELCITKHAVWLLESSGRIYRRFGVSEKNPCGDYWKQIPGQFECLSATEDDDLWGLHNGSMFCHYSFVLYNLVEERKKPPVRTISEDDWEDIMEDLDD